MLTAETIEAEGAAALRSHGRTFHLAHRLLGADAAKGVHLLYGFCRYVDDAVDEATASEGARALAAIRRDLERDRSDVKAVAGFLVFRRRYGLDESVSAAFLDGVELDLTPRVLASQAQLDRYCYRVAGTVGLMMCALFGVDDRAALPFAVDLGIAMQLTNICRDVLEDAERGRVYLPRTTLGAPVRPEDLVRGDPDAMARARSAVEELLARATLFYRSADVGVSMLPARVRYAVLAASRAYEAIGPRILAHPEGGLPRRAFVGTAGKAFHALRGVTGALARGRRSRAGGGAIHDAALHSALKGLPGTDAPTAAGAAVEPGLSEAARSGPRPRRVGPSAP